MLNWLSIPRNVDHYRLLSKVPNSTNSFLSFILPRYQSLKPPPTAMLIHTPIHYYALASS